jgi:hypothetical protein
MQRKICKQFAKNSELKGQKRWSFNNSWLDGISKQIRAKNNPKKINQKNNPKKIKCKLFLIP